MSELILSLIDFEEKDLAQLRLMAGERKLITKAELGGEIPDEVWENAVMILGNPTPDQLKKAENLRLLQLQSAGADNYCKPGVLPEEVALCNATGSYGLAIAEYMVGVTLMMAKKLHLYRDQQFAGVWRDLGPVMPISGSSVLVIGLGDIGTEYAMRMYTLGANITGVTRTVKEGPPFVEKMATTESLDELLPEADTETCGSQSSGLTAPANREHHALLFGCDLTIFFLRLIGRSVGKAGEIFLPCVPMVSDLIGHDRAFLDHDPLIQFLDHQNTPSLTANRMERSVSISCLWSASSRCS